MTARSLVLLLAIIAAGALGAWTLIVTLPGANDEPTEAALDAESASVATEPTSTVTATLFYVSPGGKQLVGVEREVPQRAGTTEQARQIVEQQLLPPEPPLTSAIPEGTTLLGLYISDRGDTFVDLSRDVSTEHQGGSLDELLTIYAIVNGLTVNVPTVQAVQILIEGREVDTLAGHVDLRRPLAQSLKWVDRSSAGAAPAP